MSEYKLLDRPTGWCNESPGGLTDHDRCDGVVAAPRSARGVAWYVCNCPAGCHGDDPIDAAKRAVEDRYSDVQARKDERKEQLEDVRSFYRRLDRDNRCFCGCGGSTKGGKFKPGHDSKLKSRLVKSARRGDSDAHNRLQVLEWTQFV